MTTEQINSIIVQFDKGQEYFVWQMKEANSDMDEEARLEQFYTDILLPIEINNEEDEKVLALMEHTGEAWDEAEAAIDGSYTVLTDSEADSLVDDRLDEYINEAVISLIPDHLQQYFDSDAWKADDDRDRGSWLNTQNGEEDEEVINSTTYYIYKV